MTGTHPTKIGGDRHGCACLQGTLAITTRASRYARPLHSFQAGPNPALRAGPPQNMFRGIRCVGKLCCVAARELRPMMMWREASACLLCIALLSHATCQPDG